MRNDYFLPEYRLVF